MSTLDAHLVALDAKTGNVIWNIEVIDHAAGYSKTAAPLVVKNLVVTGIAGGDYGIRGFIDAYDAETGDRVWRFYTIPAAGEPGNDTWEGDSWKTGGAATWVTGSFDPELNLVYWGTGNPGPDFNGEDREGDNLYSNCVLALDADTGELEWYFQFTPHDVWDWDAAQIPVLADTEFDGQQRKLMLWANRNAFFYVLDRGDRRVLARQVFCQADLGGAHRRERSTDLPPRHHAKRRRHAGCPTGGGRCQLVVDLIQPQHGTSVRHDS